MVIQINLKKEIKSIFILKKILSYLRKNKELSIFVNSKYFQRKLNYNIEYYKKISGKYKIAEKNGKGKEYTFYNELVFEGEYLNGKKNGKGKAI